MASVTTAPPISTANSKTLIRQPLTKYFAIPDFSSAYAQHAWIQVIYAARVTAIAGMLDMPPNARSRFILAVHALLTYRAKRSDSTTVWEENVFQPLIIQACPTVKNMTLLVIVLAARQGSAFITNNAYRTVTQTNNASRLETSQGVTQTSSIALSALLIVTVF